ncbi:MAG: ThiS family protein [Syntrophaceae bacterium PtaU1.Bin231]|nr:MAG: ThiS family protein [Syntrophaceae bacterium PtaU1.Bin231]HOG17264.1 MoaD family protein [Syntrophales bacterium]
MADITVEVRAFADFRSVLGARTKVVLSEGQTVKDLLEVLFERHDGLREKILDSEGRPGEGVDIILNGRNVGYTKDLTVKLRDGDQIFFFPPLSGG